MIIMDLEKRVTLMVRLGEYFKAMEEELVEIGFIIEHLTLDNQVLP